MILTSQGGMWAAGAGVAGAGLFIFGYIFIAGSKPGANPDQDKFINKTCTPNKGILTTVLTWGYFKASWRRFRVDMFALLTGEPKARAGKKAVDASLISLDGKELCLLEDYVEKMPKGMPLVLNMGSLT